MAYIQTFPDCPFEVIQQVSNVLGAAKASVPQKVGRHCPSPKKGSEVRVALVPGRAQGLASAVAYRPTQRMPMLDSAEAEIRADVPWRREIWFN